MITPEAPHFPPGFFDRLDPGPDSAFYATPRFVHHIDDHAIAAVTAFHERIEARAAVLDLMSSWVSHLATRPRHLTVLGMNQRELEANPLAHRHVVHDLNAAPTLPFDDSTFDTTVCTVSVDYLTQPVAVFAEVGRVLKPGGTFACTFSNRLFPTKAVRGWLETDDEGHCAIVAEYFVRSGAFEAPRIDILVPPGTGADPLYAVWAATSP